jgi:LD-carboxypeptidase C-terminal domain
VLRQPADYNDEEGDWADPAVVSAEPPGFEAGLWSWHGPKTTITGAARGGCLEILDFQLRASRYLLPEAGYEGCILFCETSEELPSADYVYRILMCVGERELLQRFAAIVWGRPKAWFPFEQRNDPAAKARCTDEQRRPYSRRQPNITPASQWSKCGNRID